MAVGASKVLEGDSRTPNRVTEALGSSPTTVINSPEKAQDTSYPSTMCQSTSLPVDIQDCHNSALWTLPNALVCICFSKATPTVSCSRKGCPGADSLGYWGLGKLASGRCPGRPWIHCQEGRWGGGRSPDLESGGLDLSLSSVEGLLGDLGSHLAFLWLSLLICQTRVPSG